MSENLVIQNLQAGLDIESAKNRAANQTVGEVIAANIQLRAEAFLYEKRIKQLNAEIESLKKQNPPV